MSFFFSFLLLTTGAKSRPMDGVPLVVPQTLFSSLSCLLAMCEEGKEPPITLDFGSPTTFQGDCPAPCEGSSSGLPDTESGPIIVLLGENGETNETEVSILGKEEAVKEAKDNGLVSQLIKMLFSDISMNTMNMMQDMTGDNCTNCTPESLQAAHDNVDEDTDVFDTTDIIKKIPPIVFAKDDNEVFNTTNLSKTLYGDDITETDNTITNINETVIKHKGFKEDIEIFDTTEITKSFPEDTFITEEEKGGFHQTDSSDMVEDFSGVNINQEDINKIDTTDIPSTFSEDNIVVEGDNELVTTTDIIATILEDNDIEKDMKLFDTTDTTIMFTEENIIKRDEEDNISMTTPFSEAQIIEEDDKIYPKTTTLTEDNINEDKSNIFETTRIRISSSGNYSIVEDNEVVDTTDITTRFPDEEYNEIKDYPENVRSSARRNISASNNINFEEKIKIQNKEDTGASSKNTLISVNKPQYTNSASFRSPKNTFNRDRAFLKQHKITINKVKTTPTPPSTTFNPPKGFSVQEGRRSRRA